MVAFYVSRAIVVLKYRCHILDNVGRSADTQIFSARNDSDAAAYAFAAFIQKGPTYDSFEVWRQNKLIHVYHREIQYSDIPYQVRAHVGPAPNVLNHLLPPREMKKITEDVARGPSAGPSAQQKSGRSWLAASQ